MSLSISSSKFNRMNRCFASILYIAELDLVESILVKVIWAKEKFMTYLAGNIIDTDCWLMKESQQRPQPYSQLHIYMAPLQDNSAEAKNTISRMVFNHWQNRKDKKLNKMPTRLRRLFSYVKDMPLAYE